MPWSTGWTTACGEAPPSGSGAASCASAASRGCRPARTDPGRRPRRPGVALALLECVVNVSEGQDGAVIDALAAAAGPCLLDVHSDRDHHRSVLTLAGPE